MSSLLAYLIHLALLLTAFALILWNTRKFLQVSEKVDRKALRRRTLRSPWIWAIWIISAFIVFALIANVVALARTRDWLFDGTPLLNLVIVSLITVQTYLQRKYAEALLKQSSEDFPSAEHDGVGVNAPR